MKTSGLHHKSSTNDQTESHPWTYYAASGALHLSAIGLLIGLATLSKKKTPAPAPVLWTEIRPNAKLANAKMDASDSPGTPQTQVGILNKTKATPNPPGAVCGRQAVHPGRR